MDLCHLIKHENILSLTQQFVSKFCVMFVTKIYNKRAFDSKLATLTTQYMEQFFTFVLNTAIFKSFSLTMSAVLDGHFHWFHSGIGFLSMDPCKNKTRSIV